MMYQGESGAGTPTPGGGGGSTSDSPQLTGMKGERSLTCAGCKASKVRCDRKRPCERCEKKNQPCEEPPFPLMIPTPRGRGAGGGGATTAALGGGGGGSVLLPPPSPLIITQPASQPLQQQAMSLAGGITIKTSGSEGSLGQGAGGGGMGMNRLQPPPPSVLSHNSSISSTSPSTSTTPTSTVGPGPAGQGGGGAAALPHPPLTPKVGTPRQSISAHTALMAEAAFRRLGSEGILQQDVVSRVLQHWLFMSECWGLDRSRGLLVKFASIAQLTTAELRRSLAGNEHPLQRATQAPTPLQPVHPFLAVLDDWSAAVALHVCDMKEGVERVTANGRFEEVFCGAKEALDRISAEQIPFWFLLVTLVAAEDRMRLVDEIMAMTFRSPGPLEDRNMVLKCTDRHGSSFLGIVRLRSHRDLARQYDSTIISLQPLPLVVPPSLPSPSHPGTTSTTGPVLTYAATKDGGRWRYAELTLAVDTTGKVLVLERWGGGLVRGDGWGLRTMTTGTALYVEGSRVLLIRTPDNISGGGLEVLSQAPPLPTLITHPQQQVVQQQAQGGGVLPNLPTSSSNPSLSALHQQQQQGAGVLARGGSGPVTAGGGYSHSNSNSNIPTGPAQHQSALPHQPPLQQHQHPSPSHDHHHHHPHASPPPIPSPSLVTHGTLTRPFAPPQGPGPRAPSLSYPVAGCETQSTTGAGASLYRQSSLTGPISSSSSTATSVSLPIHHQQQLPPPPLPNPPPSLHHSQHHHHLQQPHQLQQQQHQQPSIPIGGSDPISTSSSTSSSSAQLPLISPPTSTSASSSPHLHQHPPPPTFTSSPHLHQHPLLPPPSSTSSSPHIHQHPPLPPPSSTSSSPHLHQTPPPPPPPPPTSTSSPHLHYQHPPPPTPTSSSSPHIHHHSSPSLPPASTSSSPHIHHQHHPSSLPPSSTSSHPHPSSTDGDSLAGGIILPPTKRVRINSGVIPPSPLQQQQQQQQQITGQMSAPPLVATTNNTTSTTTTVIAAAAPSSNVATAEQMAGWAGEESPAAFAALADLIAAQANGSLGVPPTFFASPTDRHAASTAEGGGGGSIPLSLPLPILPPLPSASIGLPPSSSSSTSISAEGGQGGVGAAPFFPTTPEQEVAAVIVQAAAAMSAAQVKSGGGVVGGRLPTSAATAGGSSVDSSSTLGGGATIGPHLGWTSTDHMDSTSGISFSPPPEITVHDGSHSNQLSVSMGSEGGGSNLPPGLPPMLAKTDSSTAAAAMMMMTAGGGGIGTPLATSTSEGTDLSASTTSVTPTNSGGASTVKINDDLRKIEEGAAGGQGRGILDDAGLNFFQ